MAFYIKVVLTFCSQFCIIELQAAEALGAIGLRSNIPLLKNSLDRDPAQEVRETCELALSRIEELPNGSENVDSSATGASPFLSVDPAAPSGSPVHQLRFVWVRKLLLYGIYNFLISY